MHGVGSLQVGVIFFISLFFLILQLGTLIKAMIIIGCAGAQQQSDLTQTAPMLSALVLSAGITLKLDWFCQLL